MSGQWWLTPEGRMFHQAGDMDYGVGGDWYRSYSDMGITPLTVLELGWRAAFGMDASPDPYIRAKWDTDTGAWVEWERDTHRAR